MQRSPTGSVVVGVDGSPEALVAARYAVGQAARRHLDLLLVHGYPLPMVEVPLAGDYLDSLEEAGHRILADAVAALDIPVRVQVSTLVAEGLPAAVLQRLSRSARLMVVGQHSSGWLDRLYQGSVTSPLAHRAGCPVVVVPPGWSERREERRPVVVALDGEVAAQAALELAFDEAELLGSHVVALHAIAPDALESSEAAGRNVAEMLAGVREDHPGTLARVLTLRGDPQRVIFSAAQSAAVLVVGPPHSDGLAVWSRSVARRVLAAVECPVIVVPSRQHTSATAGTDVLVAR